MNAWTHDAERAQRPIRVAVVGLGWAATSIWLPRLREHPAYTVAAVVDPNPAAREAVAHDRAGTLLLSSVEELTSDQVDLAVVAVPNHLHSTIACKLLTQGIPVFLEKPVCLNSGEAEQLATAERAGNSLLLAGSAARYRSDVRELRRLITDLGRIRHVELSWVRARGVPDAGGWFTQRDLAGGGALVDLGWHLLDTVAPLLGSVDFDQVIGSVSDDFVNAGSARAAWRDSEDPEGAADGSEDGSADAQPAVCGDVEDTVRAFLITGSGVSISLRASWASHEAEDVTRIRIDGSGGTARLRCTFGFSPNRRPGGSSLTFTRDGVTSAVPLADEAIGAEYFRQLDELPGLLADPEGQGKTIDEVHRTIGVIERIYGSARSARPRTGERGRRAPERAGTQTFVLHSGDHHETALGQ